MKHYHGLPITPATAAFEAIHAGHAFVCHTYLQQAEMRERGLIFKGRFVKHKFVRYLDKRMHRRFCEL